MELARASYRAGQRAQQDVLRLSLELSRLHRDLAHIEQERISARALLNTLMNRPLDAPLGPPAELDPPALPRLPPATAGAAAGRDAPSWWRREPPCASSEAALDLARREGRWPSLTVGADYMYMPAMPEPHGYGAMLMVNLPWLSAGRRDAVRAAEHALAAERHALESVRNVLAYELRDARARYDAARVHLRRSSTRTCCPRPSATYETAQAGYAAGQGDAMRAGRCPAELSRTSGSTGCRALVHLATAAADLARALAETGGGADDRLATGSPSPGEPPARRRRPHDGRRALGPGGRDGPGRRRGGALVFRRVAAGRLRPVRRPGQLYYCPMHPQIVQDHPGQCPICSMSLVPKPPGPAQPRHRDGDRCAGRGRRRRPPGRYHCPMHPQVTSDDPEATLRACAVA